MRRKVPGRARWAALAMVLGLLLTACSERLPQDALDPHGPIARKQDHLWNITLAIATVTFFLVEGLIVYLVIRFRQRSADDVPKQIHGNPPVEIFLTALPAAILFVLAIPTVTTIFDLARRPHNPLPVTVAGRQFWWEFDYSNGVRTATELHIPTGRPVYLSLRGPDVIHSFWIPKLAGKRDVVPARTNHLIIQADRPGTYLGQCAEFCGLSHANMRMRVIAQPPAEFARWLSQQRLPAAAKVAGTAGEGQQLFTTKGCSGCHAVDGVSEGRVGPNLTHLQSRTTFAGGIFRMSPANLARWLRNPPGEKPGSKMPNLKLTEEEIAKLVAYLETLT